MKQKFSIKRKFAFEPVTEKLLRNIVNDLSRNKAAGGDMPLNLLKESTIVLLHLVRNIDEALVKSEFPDPLNLSNIFPLPKKEDPTDKTNYRPVSVLPVLSKVFEKVM